MWYLGLVVAAAALLAAARVSLRRRRDGPAVRGRDRPRRVAPDGGEPWRELGEGLVRELTLLSEEVAADLDRRARELRVLLTRADDTLRALHQATVVAQGTSVPLAAAGAAAGPAPAVGPVAGGAGAPARAARRERFREVWSLADAGHLPGEIARRTRLSQGEIRLILALRKAGEAG